MNNEDNMNENDPSENKRQVGPEILNGFNFDKRDRSKKSRQPGQGLLILLIILGSIMISLGSYLLIEMPSHNVTGADRIQAFLIIGLMLAAGAFVTIIPAVTLAHGRFRGGSHEND